MYLKPITINSNNNDHIKAGEFINHYQYYHIGLKNKIITRISSKNFIPFGIKLNIKFNE
jgi:hypothetical protein